MLRLAFSVRVSSHRGFLPTVFQPGERYNHHAFCFLISSIDHDTLSRRNPHGLPPLRGHADTCQTWLSKTTRCPLLPYVPAHRHHHHHIIQKTCTAGHKPSFSVATATASLLLAYSGFPWISLPIFQCAFGTLRSMSSFMSRRYLLHSSNFFNHHALLNFYYSQSSKNTPVM